MCERLVSFIKVYIVHNNENKSVDVPEIQQSLTEYRKIRFLETEQILISDKATNWLRVRVSDWDQNEFNTDHIVRV